MIANVPLSGFTNVRSVITEGTPGMLYSVSVGRARASARVPVVVNLDLFTGHIENHGPKSRNTRAK